MYYFNFKRRLPITNVLITKFVLVENENESKEKLSGCRKRIISDQNIQ